ncbi:MAG: DUF3365 domain-containing protein [Burkholderiaceae bacterium]|jgi:hypothetical protein|nr:DUF3365 domain-containing protein [Burkholderiaceae bacterium]
MWAGRGHRRTRAGQLALAWLCALPLASGHASDDPLRAQTDEARRATSELLGQVRGELVRAMEASGPLRAIVVCKYTVPEISSVLSRKYGARLTRVSLRPRNPALGGADVWEQTALLAFEQRLAKGEKPEAMELADVVTEPAGRFYRYARALPMLPICSGCHGSAEQISEAVRAQLANEYPHDRSLGTSVGQLRGAVTFKKPLAIP